MIEESLAEAARRVPEVMFDAEHFFDGYAADPGYALACLEAASRGGRALDRAVRHQRRPPAARDRKRGRAGRTAIVPPERLGIHTHNDTENAVANTPRRGAGRRAPGPGHAERPGRALRQRQPGRA